MEMKNLQNLRKFSYTILYVFIVLLILSTPAAAEFFKGNLTDFVKSEKIISIPIFSAADKIEIQAGTDTILSAADKEDISLKAGETYFISQNDIKKSKETQTAAELKAGWGIQIMASST